MRLASLITLSISLFRSFLFAAIFIILLSSCAQLKSYQRVYVDDPEMQMGDGEGAQFEGYVETIRGGSVPAKSKKGGGGCGCN